VRWKGRDGIIIIIIMRRRRRSFPPKTAAALITIVMMMAMNVSQKTVESFQTSPSKQQLSVVVVEEARHGHLTARWRRCNNRIRRRLISQAGDNEKENETVEDEEEVFKLSNARRISSNNENNENNNDNNSDNSDYYFMDDLTPPPVNFARNSILFSDNPSTKRRNNVLLDVWNVCQTYLPAIVTGAWPWRRQRQDGVSKKMEPTAALYNMILVRLPVVAVGVLYWKQLLWDHHDLVMDFGVDGPQVMNPLLVTLVLCLILL
jgi:hypothetical protein